MRPHNTVQVSHLRELGGGGGEFVNYTQQSLTLKMHWVHFQLRVSSPKLRREIKAAHLWEEPYFTEMVTQAGE